MTFRSLPLSDRPEIVGIGRNAHGFEPVDRYSLPDLWSLHLFGYEARIRVGEDEFHVHPGWIGLTPPGMTIETHYTGISVHIYVHFRAYGDAVSVPAMQDLGGRYDDFYRRLNEVRRHFSDQPSRVSACVWDILWSLTDGGLSSDSPAMHPAVVAAVDRISRNLSEPLSVEALAQEVGVSYSYLARLFQQAFGDTVVAYIRRQRLERARHLLQRSTLPIKSIAASVGVPDLQHFNKMVRAEYGASPRSLRQGDVGKVERLA